MDNTQRSNQSEIMENLNYRLGEIEKLKTIAWDVQRYGLNARKLWDQVATYGSDINRLAGEMKLLCKDGY